MPFFQSDEILFHYLDMGQGNPFVFQHGLGGDTNQTRDTFLPPLPCRLLTLDCRGHGQSGLGNPHNLSFDRFADDLLIFVKQIKLQKVVLGGISMGAGIALNFAIRYPQYVKAIVLVRPAWLENHLPVNVQVYPRIAALIRQAGPERGSEIFKQSREYQDILLTHPAAASSLVKQFERPRALETVDILDQIPKDSPTTNRMSWTQIGVPTLVLANDLDPVHPYAYGKTLADAIPGAKLEKITSKEIDAHQHSRDIQQAVERFMAALA